MNKDIVNEVMKNLPHAYPFLFVTEFLELNENNCVGTYHLKEDEYFYQGHFPEKPVTPGVILTEICCQIGVMCLGLYEEIEKDFPNYTRKLLATLSNTNIDFLKPVFPGEVVTVKSSKLYYRFGKIKCKVELFNAANELACRGTIEGFIREDNKS